jgi:hypothetical protein
MYPPAMTDPRDARIAELEAENAALKARVAALNEQIRELTRRLGGRKAHYGGKPKKGPHGKPGRKPGRGPFTRRKEPAAEDVTRREQARVAAPHCPRCNGKWARRTEYASTTDIPPQPKPLVTMFEVEVCECEDCGHRERGKHPELAVDQCGATAHRVGPVVKAAALALHHGVGIPRRQVPVVLGELTGARITQSALTQDALKRGEKLAPVHEQLRKDVVSEQTANTDDTGWRVGGKGAFMMNANNHDTSFIQIREHHRAQEVLEIFPADWPGILGTDRSPTYDAHCLRNVRQQKCNGHILVDINEAMELQSRANQWFGRNLKDILQPAMALHRDFRAGRIDHTAFLRAGDELNDELTELLRPRSLTDPNNQRLLNTLGWQQDRGNILRYLQAPEIDPTNNTSERDLRGAVKARKVSHCNKNWLGARTTEVITSIILTVRKRLPGVGIINALLEVFRTGVPPPRLLTAAPGSG